MAKKNNKRKRKRKPLKANPKRQATDSLRGYRYQILHSVNAWLNLADDETLYLEGVEDFDIVSDRAATLVQVKDTQHNITLKFQEVSDAINHYWESQTKYPDLTIKFRFITRSKIGKEQGDPFGKGKRGLEVWKHCSSGEASIIKISEFLQTQERILDEIKTFLRQADLQRIYEQLIKSITWETGSKPAKTIEQSINEKLINHGHEYKIQASYATNVREALLNEAFRVATHPENRELTKAHFLEIFEEKTTIRVPIQQYIQKQQPPDSTLILNYIKAGLDRIKAVLVGGTPDLTIQSQPQSPIQNAIPPLYDDVIQRTGLLTSIQTKLQSEDIVVIHGGVDKGKTTLAKLAANAIDSSWCWLNLREKDPTQVTQLLQQLDIKINNQSSQINVVLDDLNLQPQQLQAYEEILGMVVYSVRARGAKLLITSQHKPPNNFIRILGLSPSAIIDKLDFTMSEIEQFSQKMACPTEDVETWINLIQAHTGGHPRLVHALLTQLREREWKQQDIIENILQTPSEVLKERESARQLLMSLPEDRREFLYRLSLLIEFRKDYAINIGEIPVPIPRSGDIFSQLVGPWIDQVNETYYTISPLLKDAAREVWSESKITELHTQIANSILKTKNLTTTEAWAVFTHSVTGQYKEGIIAFISSLMNAAQDDWKNLCQEFSWLVHIKIDSQGELFPGNAFINQMFRSLQYQIAVEVKPELVPKIFEIWDKETKPYEPRQSYLLSRLMLATEILRYDQAPFPVKKLIGYLKEMIGIRERGRKVWEIYLNSLEQVVEYITDESRFFSFLFSFVYTRRVIYASFLNDLIDALDELQPEARTLLLVDFEGDNIESRLLIDGVWRSEANLENSDWPRCIEVFDKVIEKTIAWGYPAFAAASARGKAIIHDEYLNDPDTAHEVLQDITSKVGPLPVIEEEQALVYFRQEHYKEALNIYERILSEWNPPSEQLNIGPLEEYRRAAICAAQLGDWKKATTFFESGAKKTQKIENTERYIGLYADAGFAHFKGGNMLDSIELLSLALQKFETIPQDNTDVEYFTLKQRLVYTMRWVAVPNRQDHSSELEALPAGFCSNPDTDEKVLDLPDSPIGEAWIHLAQIEYKFGRSRTAFERALQITDRDAYPVLDTSLSLLETQYDFRNKTFDNLPQRIYQLAKAYASIRKHGQSGRGIGETGIYSISIPDLSNFASVETVVSILGTALLVQLSTGVNTSEILVIWRTNSSELPIKENVFTALDLIESTLLGDQNSALTVLKTQQHKPEERFVAALKVVENKETGPGDLLYAHTFIATSLIGKTWEGFALIDLAKLLSIQWKKKIGEIPIKAVSQLEKACNSSEVGKKKIGQILLAALQAVSPGAPSEIFQEFRDWIESESK